MAYDSKAMKIALEDYQKDIEERKRQYLEKKNIILKQIPRVEEIEIELKTAYPQIIAATLKSGENPTAALEKIKTENLLLQDERALLLREKGYPVDALEEKPSCDKCKDTGYTNNGICECLLSYYKKAQNRLLSKMLDFQGQSFDSFELKWYSDKRDQELDMSPLESIKETRRRCQDYACYFGNDSENLLFCGSPGTGKTFLSTCIAKVISEQGKSVVYDTAINIFNAFEKVTFNKDEDDVYSEDVKRYLECDLLIIDDLGTEIKSSFVDSTLYRIINDRIINSKKTIISTNLEIEEIKERYTGQISSRLQGEYTVLPFFGEDIRIQKANAKK